MESVIVKPLLHASSPHTFISTFSHQLSSVYSGGAKRCEEQEQLLKVTIEDSERDQLYFCC